MGIVHRGIPEDYALKVKKKYGLDYFVETGTFHGKTTLWAAGHFKRVLTIEYDQMLHRKAAGSFHSIPQIYNYWGDSSVLLPKMLSETPGPALMWLDAHWSRDLGYIRPVFGECPVLGEIIAINNDGRDHVVFIDDARYFVKPPPKPHKPAHWPTFEEIEEAFGEEWSVVHLNTLDIIEARRT